jgi:hypothetical protein
MALSRVAGSLEVGKGAGRARGTGLWIKGSVWKGFNSIAVGNYL